MLVKFQFHIGAIRRNNDRTNYINVRFSFNSILVQLEGSNHRQDRPGRSCFNSILVQLEAGMTLSSILRSTCFNSILVQLEAPDGLGFIYPSYSFNSILVQLEAVSRTSWYTGIKEFQFHIGAIRSQLVVLSRPCTICFNSILVQLEEVSFQCFRLFGLCFNSILVQLEVSTLGGSALNLFSFNSILVQLEAKGKPKDCCMIVVSIPYWCN